MSSGRFQQKLRCGFNCALQRREPSARSWKGGTRAAPGPAQRAPAPLLGALQSAPLYYPGLLPAAPSRGPAPPRPAANRPPGRTELSWKRLRGDRASDPTFYSRALLWGGGRLGLRVAPKSIAIGGLFLFPGSRAVTELPGPYQSAAGSSRLPRAGLREPVIPPRQSQRRSAGPRRPP